MKRRALWLALGVAGAVAGCGDGSGAPCEATSDCPSGEICTDKVCGCPEAGCPEEGTYGFGGDDAVSVESLGSVEVTSAGGAEVSVSVPSGAKSVAVVLDGAGSNLVLAEKITTPGGEVVFDFQQGVTTNRTDVVDGIYTVLLPSNPAVELEAGTWTLAYLSGGGAFTGEVTAVVKTGSATAKAVDVNIYLVGLDGLTAETAPNDPGLQQLLEGVEQAWSGAGLRLGEVSWREISGEDGERLTVIDSIDGPSSELAQLFKRSQGEAGRALNLFMVSDITAGDSGFSIVGLAGGVPGPPALHGTGRSGVAVNLADLLEARAAGDDAMIEEARRLTEIIIAHETGHYLGLYHTTERNGQALMEGGITGQDPLSDTPSCPDSADANGNGSLSASECAEQDGGNLMFWSPRPDSRSLSGQQAQLLLANPLVK